MKLLGGDEDLLEEILDSAIHDFGLLLDELNSAHQHGTTAELSRILHTMKGVAGNAGANRLKNLTMRLEARAKAAQYDAVFNDLKNLGELIAEFNVARKITS